MDEDYKISYEKAIELLPDGDTIHTFINSGFMLIGADWNRQEVLDSIKKYGANRSGEVATRMNHSINFHDGEKFVFLETKKP